MERAIHPEESKSIDISKNPIVTTGYTSLTLIIDEGDEKKMQIITL